MGTDTVPANDEITGTLLVEAPLSGTYNVGSAGAYTSLTQAVAKLNSLGISASVTFLLTDASYTRPDQITAETYPITINAISGASASKTVTIKPAPSAAQTLSGSVASGAIIKLNGASFRLPDGSNSGGTDRSLTITNTSTTSPTAISMASLGNRRGRDE